MERTELNKIARHLLETGRVEVVVGYRRGTEPLTATPAFVRDPEQAATLIFDATCGTNLATYLPRLKGRKVAVVVKGCDERSVIGLLQEQQAQREDLVLLGAPCPGVLDRKRLLQATGGQSPVDGRIDAEELVLRLPGAELRLRLAEVMDVGCRVCAWRNPRLADYLIGDPVPTEERPDFDPEVAELEQATAETRWERFRQEMSKCILCFACRNLCPACYCTECFADSSNPKWVGHTDDPADAMLFHLIRWTHLAGRCTGCGACVRGCPMGVNLRLYNDKLRKEVKTAFQFEAGVDPAAKPPLVCYQPGDRNDFIR